MKTVTISSKHQVVISTGTIIELDHRIAVAAARISLEINHALVDSMILETG
jgi:hypothetical protein